MQESSLKQYIERQLGGHIVDIRYDTFQYGYIIVANTGYQMYVDQETGDTLNQELQGTRQYSQYYYQQQANSNRWQYIIPRLPIPTFDKVNVYSDSLVRVAVSNYENEQIKKKKDNLRQLYWNSRNRLGKDPLKN